MANVKKDVFGIEGMLHRKFGNGYEVRDQQVAMSIACAKAIRDREVLLAEGATGVGKSFAYLIASVSPAMRQALKENGHKGPIVISTSTKVLQDQLWEKDVPAILEATGQPLNVVLVKGRNNYVSIRRLTEFLSDVEDRKIQFETAEVGETAKPLLEKMSKWVETSDGEFSNFEEYVPPEIRAEVESTDDDCLGKHCPNYSQCLYYKAKKRRESADILIVNHAILSLSFVNSNVLPQKCSTFVVDEAHKFFDAVSGVFEIEITLRQVERFFKVYRTRMGKLRELFHKDSEEMEVLSKYLTKIEEHRREDVGIAESFFDDSLEAVAKHALDERICTEESLRFGYAAPTPALEGDALKDVLLTYTAASQELAYEFGVSLDKEDDDPDEDVDVLTKRLRNIHKSAVEMYTRLEAILSHEDQHLSCYWSSVSVLKRKQEVESYRLSLKSTPIDISKQIRPLLKSKHAVIFTSATLQVAHSFGRIRHQLGLNDAEVEVSERIYPSPFPLKKNVEIHLFDDVLLDRPHPNSSEIEKALYSDQQTALVEYYLRLREGRALVLCSSNKLLHELFDRLELPLANMGITALRQYGTDRLKETVEHFKSDETSVLFGVASCWEGLDAPGPTLETLIIPQLPFAPPHPLIEARKALLEDPDKDWFPEISLPDMLLQLKQGAGRLVRSKTDRGVIAVLSPRPLTKQYGKDIRSALPPGRIVRNHREALHFKEARQ